MDKELEKNKKETRIEKSREDKLLAFIGGKFIIYILLIVILKDWMKDFFPKSNGTL